MNSTPRYFALIPAAGIGARMAANCPKQYLHIDGQSTLQRSANAFLQHDRIAHLLVVVSREDAYVSGELAPDPRLTVLYCGGATRSESVTNGLAAMQNQVHSNDWVMVHDAARPGITAALLSRLIDGVSADDAGGLLALPVADTVKLQTVLDGKRTVTTVPRDGMWLAQTPQMFRHGQLMTALIYVRDNVIDITDDASAMEVCGFTPVLIEGHWGNTKITLPADMTLVETYLTTLQKTE